ncbi:NfeD family protein [Paenibacillus riograndensis]|uniref:NfeD family protein n=1 Tax=Paenibacillus riograndensis TaxID=483937 RepID=UPI001E605B78|nr:NfeD family protein [Paenibacillus riograndensis]
MFWLIAAGVLFVVEMMTLTFYLLWLSIGALAACLVSLLLPDAILLQVLAGSLVALVLTIFSKPLVARFRSSRGFQDTGTDIVGRQGLVVAPIEPGRYGQVKVGGDTWSATSIESLGKDEVVKVVGRSSTIIEVVRWGDMY